MYNSDMPSRAELPSTRQLFRSTLVAIVAAGAILLTVVLPAEYAIDPIGVGRWLGLTDMGQIKQQLAEEAAADAVAEPVVLVAAETPRQPVQEPVEVTAAPVQPAAPVTVIPEVTVPVAAKAVASNTAQLETQEEAASAWRDEVSITLTPGQGTEIKLVMNEGAVAQFAWEGVEGPLNYDTHGDAKGRSISYEKGRGVQSDEGELIAAFTGNHGWFFRNRTKENVTLVLRMSGDYKEVKRLL